MEYRMKCDVCGKIFCYTDEDLKENSDHAKTQTIAALGALAATLGGTTLQTHHLAGQANRHASKIVDYTQCPHCHSRSISVYTGDDTAQAVTNMPTATIKNINTSAPTESLLKRAFLFLEDEEWETADAYCEACLDKDPELAEAYLGKLMAELHVKTQTELKDLEKPFDDNANYKKTVRFGNDELKNTLCKYLELIHNRNEAARKDDILYRAKSKMAGNTISQCQEAISLLVSIAGWKDADEQKAVCYQKIEELRRKAEENRARELERQRDLEKQKKEEAEKAKERRKKLLKKAPKFAIAVLLIIIIKNAWTPKVELVAFNPVNHNDNVIYSSISKSDDYLHYCFKLKGLNIFKTYTLRNDTQWPGKQFQLSDWTWDDVTVGDVLCCEWEKGYTASNTGTMVIHILDDETGKVLGEFKMKIE